MWVVLLLAVCAGTIGYIVFHLDSGPSVNRPPTQEVKTYSDGEAYYQAQQILKDYLKAPSTAKFPSLSEAAIQHLGDTGFQIDSYVDAQNSFGAMLRSKWTVLFLYNGDYVDTYAVVLDGQTLYKRATGK